MYNVCKKMSEEVGQTLLQHYKQYLHVTQMIMHEYYIPFIVIICDLNTC